MSFITPAIIRAELTYDLIGKDSQRGITLSYGWLANQCGHFMLGFVPTHLVYLALLHWWCVPHAAIWAAFGVAGFWVLFETYNVIKPLRKQKKETRVFAPDWNNIIHDVATDLGFFLAGALLAGVLLEYQVWMLLLWLLTILLLIAPSGYWYRTKMYQQGAEYPFQFRLSQWEGTMQEANQQQVSAFTSITGGGHHVLLTGAYQSGKTPLGVALANEFSIRHQPCKYVTAMKLLSLFADPSIQVPSVPDHIWHWRNTGFLVIDDLNTGLPGEPELITPAQFRQHLQHPIMGAINQKAICEANVIWILGNAAALKSEALRNGWENMLLDLGVDPQKMLRIDLDL